MVETLASGPAMNFHFDGPEYDVPAGIIEPNSSATRARTPSVRPSQFADVQLMTYGGNPPTFFENGQPVAPPEERTSRRWTSWRDTPTASTARSRVTGEPACDIRVGPRSSNTNTVPATPPRPVDREPHGIPTGPGGRETSMQLDGKVAIVTGGGSGLGRASAIALAAAGAKVVVGDVDDDGQRER